MKQTYKCGWCGWNGTAISEQVAELLHRYPPSGRLERCIRYACYQCGQEVYPDESR